MGIAVAMQTVQRTVLCMGRKQEAVENVPCGNTVRLSITLRNCTTFTTPQRSPVCTHHSALLSACK